MNDHRTHAVLDLESRALKATKIERLLDLEQMSRSLAVLDIGCGSGGISQHIATRPAGHRVHGIDTVDTRIVKEGYTFQLVTGTALPFPSEMFDVVLSNHVIEHVGNIEAQRAHLDEVRRVLKPSGVAYLAVPNRWRLIEPHYRLPALSLWPRSWRTPYLRLLRAGEEYDVEPLEAGTIERMLATAGFRASRLGVQAIRLTLDIERGGSLLARGVRLIPDRLLRPLEPLLPTLTYRLRRA
ncbi:MAG TPA: class I SAM-dependent methyltransferase [Candidatus Limnocylindria bacterium]